MVKTIKVYDNGGETADRYTVFIGKEIYTMSDNPSSPQGFNQYMGNIDDVDYDLIKSSSRLGRIVKVSKLPKDVQKAIKQRMR